MRQSAPQQHQMKAAPMHAQAKTAKPTTTAAPASGALDQNIVTVLNETYAKFNNLQEGKNADYIPALAKVDPNLFGIALITVDGKVYTAGDIKTQVSIQSISKVFTMAQVIQEQGLESVEKRIGVDATGARFLGGGRYADRRRVAPDHQVVAVRGLAPDVGLVDVVGEDRVERGDVARHARHEAGQQRRQPDAQHAGGEGADEQVGRRQVVVELRLSVGV